MPMTVITIAPSRLVVGRMVAQILVLDLVQRRHLSKGGCPTIQEHARVCLLMAIKGKKIEQCNIQCLTIRVSSSPRRCQFLV